MIKRLCFAYLNTLNNSAAYILKIIKVLFFFMTQQFQRVNFTL